MKFAATRGESNLDELVLRLVKKKGVQGQPAVSKIKLGKFRKSLLSTNPTLSNLKKISVGTVISIPDGTGVEIDEEETWSPKIGNVEILHLVRQNILEAGTAVERAKTRTLEESERTLRFLGKAPFKSEASHSKKFSAQVKSVREAAKEESTRVKQRAAVESKALENAAASLGRLLNGQPLSDPTPKVNPGAKMKK